MASLKAIILIGGPSKGTRFRPLSLAVPKPLFPIGGVPLLYHHVAACAALAPLLKEVILVGFFEPTLLETFIAETSAALSIPIRYLREDGGLGTAGGLYRFQQEICEDMTAESRLFVLHCDVLCPMPLRDVLRFHDAHGKIATVVSKRVPDETAHLYGCLVFDKESNEILHYAEKPETFVSNVVNCGIYLFSMSIFETLAKVASSARKSMKLSESYDIFPENRPSLKSNGDVHIRLEQDLFVKLAGKQALYAYLLEDWWIQLKHAGSPIECTEFLLAEYRKSRPELLSSNTPYQTLGNVIVHPSAIIHPTARIGPNVTIGRNVKIGQGVRIKHSIILDDSEIKDRACIMYSILAEHCKVGRWSRIEGCPDINSSLRVGGITIFGSGVEVEPEVSVRNCIVLPHKGLSANQANEIIL